MLLDGCTNREIGDAAVSGLTKPSKPTSPASCAAFGAKTRTQAARRPAAGAIASLHRAFTADPSASAATNCATWPAAPACATGSGRPPAPHASTRRRCHHSSGRRARLCPTGCAAAAPPQCRCAHPAGGSRSMITAGINTGLNQLLRLACKPCASCHPNTPATQQAHQGRAHQRVVFNHQHQRTLQIVLLHALWQAAASRPSAAGATVGNVSVKRVPTPGATPAPAGDPASQLCAAQCSSPGPAPCCGHAPDCPPGKTP